MESSRLPTPSNLFEIIASIIKSDMSTYSSMRPIQTFSDAYTSGKKEFKDFTKNSRKRGATPDGNESSAGPHPRAGPSHMITGIHITTTIKPMQPSTSAPPSYILSDWTNIVSHDTETMKTMRKRSGHSDAYLNYVTRDVRKLIDSQKIDSPWDSIKDSIIKVIGDDDGDMVAMAIDLDDGVRESLRHTLAKRIKYHASNNPDCAAELKENIKKVFK